VRDVPAVGSGWLLGAGLLTLGGMMSVSRRAKDRAQEVVNAAFEEANHQGPFKGEWAIDFTLDGERILVEKIAEALEAWAGRGNDRA
jgi:hypothetical protein